jgi:5-methylcytosine-specific restriction enzyme subunit McrC
MLKTLKKTPFKKIDLTNLKTEKFHLLDIFIEMFIDEVFKNFIHKERFFVEFDEYLPNGKKIEF